MTYRGALIGCGYISRQQLWAWDQIERAEIVAVCDLEEDKVRSRAEQFGISGVYTDYRRMLDEESLDFVDIATRPMNHLELTKAGADRGLHVLCQKPVAETLEELRDMIALCEQAGVLFMVNENYRHQPWYRQVKTLLEEGALGMPYDAQFVSRWRSSLPTPNFEGQGFFQDMERLIVYELGVHYLDTARFLFGEAQTIYARTRQVSPHIAGEDKALVVADFGPLTCLLDTNWYAFRPPVGETVTGDRFKVEGTHGTAVLSWDGSLRLYAEGDTRTWEFPSNAVDLSFVSAQAHFIDCLDSDLEPETSGGQTLRTMALVFGAYRSAREGRVVSVDEFEL